MIAIKNTTGLLITLRVSRVSFCHQLDHFYESRCVCPTPPPQLGDYFYKIFLELSRSRSKPPAFAPSPRGEVGRNFGVHKGSGGKGGPNEISSLDLVYRANRFDCFGYCFVLFLS